MAGKESTKDVLKRTMEEAIDQVRTVRNNLIKDLLSGNKLNIQYLERFGKEPSPIKQEFLKRDLQSLIIAPVDLVHYAGLIKKLKEENLQSIDEEHLSLFIAETNTLFEKYA